MKAVYIAHPLSRPEGDELDAESREHLNRAEATRFVVLAAELGFCPMASWIVLSAALPETPERRAMGLALDCEQIGRCDEIWLCGPRESAGMTIEREHAQTAVLHGRVKIRNFIGQTVDEVRTVLLAGGAGS